MCLKINGNNLERSPLLFCQPDCVKRKNCRRRSWTTKGLFGHLNLSARLQLMTENGDRERYEQLCRSTKAIAVWLLLTLSLHPLDSRGRSFPFNFPFPVWSHFSSISQPFFLCVLPESPFRFESQTPLKLLEIRSTVGGCLVTEITECLIKILLLLLMTEVAHDGECGCDGESDGYSSTSHGYDSERYSRAKEGKSFMQSWDRLMLQLKVLVFQQNHK